MAKKPKKKLKPGTLLQSSMAVVDARGRVRTLPKDQPGREKMLAGIKRLAQKHTEKIDVPKTLPRHAFLKILDRLGFKRIGTAQFFSTRHGKIVLPMGGQKSAEVSVRTNPAVRKVVEAYLRSGGEL